MAQRRGGAVHELKDILSDLEPTLGPVSGSASALQDPVGRSLGSIASIVYLYAPAARPCAHRLAGGGRRPSGRRIVISAQTASDSQVSLAARRCMARVLELTLQPGKDN